MAAEVTAVVRWRGGRTSRLAADVLQLYTSVCHFPFSTIWDTVIEKLKLRGKGAGSGHDCRGR